AGLQDQHRDEDERHEHRRAETEVGPLLSEQLEDLPLVDARHATASCSVMSRKSSSSVATRGVSAEMPIPAWPSAMLSDSMAAGSAWNRSSPCSTSGPSIPCASRSARARSGSLVRNT